jgi:hypothetical protein
LSYLDQASSHLSHLPWLTFVASSKGLNLYEEEKPLEPFSYYRKHWSHAHSVFNKMRFAFRRNIVGFDNDTDLSTCHYDPAADPKYKLCPIFKLGEIAKLAGVDSYSDLLGGVNSNTFFFFDVVNVAIVSSLLDY